MTYAVWRLISLQIRKSILYSCMSMMKPISDAALRLWNQVTSISDLRLNTEGITAGDKLEVRLGVKFTKGNRGMTMYETLWKKDGTLIAHAEISLLCMNNETKKFRSVPQWVQDIVRVPSAAAVTE